MNSNKSIKIALDEASFRLVEYWGVTNSKETTSLTDEEFGSLETSLLKLINLMSKTFKLLSTEVSENKIRNYLLDSIIFSAISIHYSSDKKGEHEVTNSIISDILNEAYLLLLTKNDKYGTKNRPYRTMEFSNGLGIPVWKNSLLKLTDKMSIINIFLKNNLNYKHDESFKETLQDVISYCVISLIYFDLRDTEYSFCGIDDLFEDISQLINERNE